VDKENDPERYSVNITQKHKILLVDDSPTILQILTQLLKDDQFQIIAAMSGVQALQLAKKTEPDLILMDIEMPEMNGYETCRLLKQDSQLADIPVLFISGYSNLEDKLKSFEVGGLDFISKPVQKGELLAHIKTHLTLRRLQKELLSEIEDKQRLIRILTHDISNPLTATVGQLDLALIKSAKDCDKTRITNNSDNNTLHPDSRLQECLVKARNAAHQALNIIEHVRHMDAANSGKIEFNLVPVSLKEVFYDSLAVFQDRLNQKNITVETSPPLEKIDTNVMAEKVSLTTNVLNNLVTNAVKFSFPGSRIRLTVLREENWVRVTLHDSGIGIPKPLLARLFNSTEPTTREGTEGETGTGFGMPIVKKYMELYGGSIAIVSRGKDEYPDQHGTTITLSFKSPDNQNPLKDK
jgi:two-component system, sensor histidine kinase and response regulator